MTVEIADSAKIRLIHLLSADPAAKNKFVRISVLEDDKTFQYILSYDEKKGSDTEISICSDKVIVIDNNLYEKFFDSAEIDWKHDGKYGPGFVIHKEHHLVSEN